jgi:hypothetical protein
MDSLQQRIAALRPRAEALCAALRREAERWFGAGVLAACVPDAAAYRLERDAASGADTLLGEWLDGRGYRIGMLIFHADGSSFAEFDIVRAHPKDPRWFVEAVEAWAGAPDANSCVRADLRLLASL